MYKVYKRESENFPRQTFTIYYEVDLDGENTEWRVCVQDIVRKLRPNYNISEVDVPKYEGFEDFVELKYSINGKPLEFSCDFLLYSIYVTTDSIELTESLRDFIGDQVGWEET